MNYTKLILERGPLFIDASTNAIRKLSENSIRNFMSQIIVKIFIFTFVYQSNFERFNFESVRLSEEGHQDNVSVFCYL